MQKRDTRNYSLWDGNKKVYIGITDNPQRRQVEHEQEGKRFDRLKAEGPAISRDTALDREQEALETYRANHNGRTPKYND